ncbi:MAG: hypothetical protein ABSF98_29785 [Bryobacteraceae bacterium]|jgi:hypothetical protein
MDIDRNAILAVDICTFQLREYRAMARLGEMLGKKTEASEYRRKADRLCAAIQASRFAASAVRISFRWAKTSYRPQMHAP